MMMMNKWWAMTLAAIGGGIIAYACAIAPRAERRLTERRQHKEDLQTWEGEGGNLAPITSARS